jgi:Ras-related C3 botulinum toxin substrate 1
LTNLFLFVGSDEFNSLRPLSYPGTDVFLLCFSLFSPSSLDAIRTKWYPEVKEHADGTPIILVGTKLDLREKESAVATLKESGQEPVTPEQGAAVRQVDRRRQVPRVLRVDAGGPLRSL